MRIATLVVIAGTLLSARAGAAPAAAAPPPEMKRSDSGKVTGWVVDAATRRPVAGALVSLEVDGAFPSSGKAVARTDASGRYEAHAPLGKIYSKLDWGRVLTMHPLSLIFSPTAMMKETRIIDVDRFNVRVQRDGYRPFLGSVQAADVNPDGYSVRLEDVWLAAATTQLTSFSPDILQHETIESLAVTPAVCAPGERVTLTLTARLPVDRNLRYRAYLTSNNPRLIAADQVFKRQAPSREHPNRVIFTRTVKVASQLGEPYAQLGFYLIRNGRTTLVEPETTVLVQAVRAPEERKAAALVDEGYRLAKRGELDAGLGRYSAAREAAPRYFLAHLLYGDLCLKLGRPGDAAAAFRQLVALSPEDWDVARPRYVLALLATGDVAAAAGQMKDANEKTRRVPPQIYLCQARIAALEGRFDDADRSLTRAAQYVKIPLSVQLEINLRRMQAAVAAAPEDPDVRLAAARVLQDAGRNDEAIGEIQRAIRLAPGDAWAYLDLGTALAAAGRGTEARLPLERCLQLDPKNVEANLLMADLLRNHGDYAEALGRYREVARADRVNLRARHGCALMLLQQGDLAGARGEFHAAIEQGREKGKIDDPGLALPGQSIYFGPKRRLVSGFSAPESAADRVIWTALDTLDRQPRNGLAWMNIGAALVQLGVPAMALDALAKAATLEPSLAEVPFYRGLALRGLGQLAAARETLEGVVRANPLHPEARLALARILVDQGQVDQAQAQILAHCRNYPEQRGAGTL
jgi:tetratricopeptide (TPR) repeat protein